MLCPLCQARKARRSCPALGHAICPVCCGTKRQVDIRCPRDCLYLISAQEHPPAAVVKQRRHDIGVLVGVVGDLNQRQTDLLADLIGALQRYPTIDLQPLLDEDVIEATESLAATLETAACGVIYEYRPASRPADRLVSLLKPVIEAGGHSGDRAFEREAAVVLRQLQMAARQIHRGSPGNRRAFLDLLDRVRAPLGDTEAGEEKAAPSNKPSRLIVP